MKEIFKLAAIGLAAYVIAKLIAPLFLGGLMKTIFSRQNFYATMLFALIAFPVSGFAETIEQCWKIANHVKNGLPSRIDSITVITGITCAPARSARAKNEVVYVAKIELPSRQLVGVNVQELRPAALNTWCTEPSMKKLLRVYDVKYKYFSSDGKFFGDLSLANKDCH